MSTLRILLAKSGSENEEFGPMVMKSWRGRSASEVDNDQTKLDPDGQVGHDRT